MLNRLIPLCILLLWVCHSQGQTGFTVGYHYGYANPKEVNRVIHAFNLRNETILTKKMHLVHGFKGYSIGFQVKGFQNSGMEFMWVGRLAVVSAQGSDGAGGMVQRDIKITSNSFNIGQYFTWNRNKYMWGYSLDFGVRFRGYTRKDDPAKISDAKWDKIFNVDPNPFQAIFNMVPTGLTLY